MSLVLEYRPTTFKEYVVSPEILSDIRAAIGGKEKPKVVFIHGDSGLGKTTLARLLAKEYSCQNYSTTNGVCNECTSCKLFNTYIKTGETLDIKDLREIDSGLAGSATQVRELIEGITASAQTSYTDHTEITIFDEVHTLSRAAQTAMLKFLEEPPRGTLTILCTTNPDQVLNTVRNRANLDINLTKPAAKDIISRLVSICKEEDISYDLRGLEIIVARSSNIVRNSIATLDQVNTARGNALHDSVEKYLDSDNLTDDSFFIFYEGVLSTGSKAKVLSLIATADANSELEMFADRLISFTKRGLYIYNGITVPGLSKPELKRYKALFTRFSIRNISQLLEALRGIKIGDIEANLLSLGYASFMQSEITENTELHLDTKSEIQDEQTTRDFKVKKSIETRAAVKMLDVDKINTELTPEELMSEFDSTQ